jgi:polyisoprenoid-binding protein YceI
MKCIAIATFFTLSSIAAQAAFGQQETFHINPQASQLSFTLGDVLHTVNGTFHVQSGDVNFSEHGSSIDGSIVVATGSGDTGNSSRDGKMKKEVLDVPRFAIASFTPKSYQGAIAPSGDSTIQVSGIFLLHGTPHPITVPMQIHIEGSNCTVKTHFVVPYVAWGLKDPSNFLLHVAKEVDIDLTLVGQVTPVK